MNWIHAELHRNREEDGREDEHCRRDVHEDAHGQQDQVDDEKDQDLVLSESDQSQTHVLGNVLIRKNPGHADGRSHQQHHDGRRGRRAEENLRQVANRDLPVGERKDECVEHCDCGGFRCGEHAGDDSAHDYHEHQEAGQRAEEMLGHLPPAHAAPHGEFPSCGNDPGHEHQREPHEDPR